MTDLAVRVRDGYAFEGPALGLGALVVDGKGDATAQVRIPLSAMNRHGLVAGATGTGKTKTLQVLAEQLSAAGVPVFLADISRDGRPGVRVREAGREAGASRLSTESCG